MKGSITIILGLVIMCIGILDILESHFVSNSSLLCTSPHPMKYVGLCHFSVLRNTCNSYPLHIAIEGRRESRKIFASKRLRFLKDWEQISFCLCISHKALHGSVLNKYLQIIDDYLF